MTEKLGVRWFWIVLVLALAGWATWKNWPLNLGIDLAGGNTLVYSVDEQVIRDLLTSGQSVDNAMDEMVRVISTRIDNLGVKDLNVRKQGRNRILIQAPRISDEELAGIKRRMVQLGDLKFWIGLGDLKGLGGGQDTCQIPGLTEGTTENYTFSQEPAEAQRKRALEEGKPRIAQAKTDGTVIPRDVYLDGSRYQLKHDDGRLLPIFWLPWASGETAKFKNLSPSETKIALDNAQKGAEYNPDHIRGGWLYADPKWYSASDPDRGFTGKDIANPRKSVDNTSKRVVVYDVARDRQGDYEEYTGVYVGRPMCIILNDEIWSNPTLQSKLFDTVQIQGGGSGFTEADQDWLINCLQSGSLRLRPRLESEDKVAAALGDIEISRGVLSTIVSAVLIFAFMLVYYRFSGVVAVISLILNLLLTIAVMALFRSTLTLPGIAGLVLTIGMAVDANILIFERIREELQKGKALTPACEAGFNRAIVTIIDSNLTTVITGIALYKFGVGPIKGFAVTLMAGLFCSLFTSITVSRLLFATALKNGWIKKLTMMQLLPDHLRIDFLSKAKPAGILSTILVVGSFAAFAGMGNSKYGLDFTGGYSVRVAFADPQPTGDVSQKISAIRGSNGAQKYPAVETTGLSDSNAGDRTYRMMDLKIQQIARTDPSVIHQRVKADFERIFGAELESLSEASYIERNDEWALDFTLNTEKDRDTIGTQLSAFRDAGSQQTTYESAIYEHLNHRQDADSNKIFAKSWRLRVSEKSLLGHEVLRDLGEVFAAGLPKAADGSVDEAKAFPRLTYVGSNVVSNLKSGAIVATILSLIGIILYIWFRFRELKYGVAAAIATFHDGIIAVGAVVVFNKLGIVHAPINLPIIAGFLTIMGYSLNDTIVQFDRVRENLGNIKGTFSEIVNISINQTLARTVLTALTTFVVVLVLFVANYGQESGIEGIAFCLLVGVIVGTYSTVYIASPIVIWLHEREERKKLPTGATVAAKPKAQTSS